MIIDRVAHAVAARLARWRSAPALHPHGVLCTGTLTVAGCTGTGWGVPWLDRPGSYRATVRWSRALGLPRRLPDGLGLAVRVEDADGPGSALDLLFTSSRPGRFGRHLPLPRSDALKGPYSTLLSYRVGDRERVLAAFPVHEPDARRKDVRPTLWQELARRPVRFALRAAAPDEPWRTFATLSLEAVRPAPASRTVSYDPYAHNLPRLHPTERLRRLRDAAYIGSRHGRTGDDRYG
ncbi:MULTISPECIES: phosphodiesterase [unclassified Streptomyces]|uniref:phosphodiesterase n=1 Tax=unclassified Streptomyces TaxID=2593676 RepID=UPI0025B3C130|nr:MULTISPECIES: phosphodiesterase [unclassified Streptomyces]MDN3250426.1 phosphodiesterase [Streptomyces sp. ZSW22]MDN3254392.1 phosphodiesterase [Streptomyces sp. MA25(2023)]